MGIIKEFKEFLKEYKVTALAVAFIMGIATTDLVKSLVDNIIMPFISPLIQNGGWETATFTFWKITLAWGAFLSALLKFLILAFVVFFSVKFILREDKSKTNKLRNLTKNVLSNNPISFSKNKK